MFIALWALSLLLVFACFASLLEIWPEFWTVRSWYRVIKCWGILSAGSTVSSLGSQSYHTNMFYLFQPWASCLTMRSNAYSEGVVRSLLKRTDIFFSSCCWVVCVSFFGEPDVWTIAEQCSLSSGTAVTLRIEKVFGAISSSVTNVCGLPLMIRKGPAFWSCSSLFLAFIISVSESEMNPSVQMRTSDIRIYTYFLIWHRTTKFARKWTSASNALRIVPRAIQVWFLRHKLLR